LSGTVNISWTHKGSAMDTFSAAPGVSRWPYS
jgi:hypothetical protein